MTQAASGIDLFIPEVYDIVWSLIILVIVAVFFFLFNLVGLPTYPSAYDKFLLAVSLVFNAVTVWMAWNWA